MEFIWPKDSFVLPTKHEEHNGGLWPMYVYNYGIACDQIKYRVIIYDIEKRHLDFESSLEYKSEL